MAQTTDALARIIPVILASLVLLAVVAFFGRLLGGRATTTPHVELELMGVAGAPPPRPDPVRTARLVVETEPAGVLVFHRRQILGKTPLEVDIPFDLPRTIGVRLRGPIFREWVGQIDESFGGLFVVRAALEPP